MRSHGVRALVACALSAVGGTPSHAQVVDLAAAVRERITVGSIDRHAYEITRHQRPSGSEGENAAIDYIVSKLAEAGVEHAVHEFLSYTSDPVSATVSVPGTDFAPEAITMSFSGATDGVEAEAVDVGELGDLPDLEFGTGELLVVRDAERFAHIRGKVAVVTGQPRNVPTLVLEQLGAVAAIFVNPEERLNDLIVTSTWGTPSLLSAHRLPELPTAQVRRGDGDRLREMMAEGPVRVRVSTRVETGWKTLRLPVAWVMPESDERPIPYALLGGHIDGWYHGGTDEGASNAAMLSLVLAFHAERERMRRGLVVAWWPGHSNARYGGSTWYADRYFDELRKRGIAYLNIDGIGQIDATRFSASTSPALEGLAIDVVGNGTSQGIRPGRPGRNSDQAFNGIGLPLLQINHSRTDEVGGYWWWHTPEDTYDKIDPDILELDAELYGDAIADLVAGPWLRVDVRAEIEALQRALRQRQIESGGVLDVAEAARRAEELSRVFEESVSALEDAEPSHATDLAVLAVIRPIHRVMFVPGSDYHPDPGIYSAALPGLEPARILAQEEPTSDRYRFAEAQLARELNRVLEALDEAMHRARDVGTRARGGAGGGEG